MASRKPAEPVRVPETAAQRWERVRAEHGPPPQSVRDLYQEIRSVHAARIAAESTKAAKGGGV
jgi:hypothetical protein